MKREIYDRELVRWVRNHYWDSLEKDKDLILRHLRTFVGDTAITHTKAEVIAETLVAHGYVNESDKKRVSNILESII